MQYKYFFYTIRKSQTIISLRFITSFILILLLLAGCSGDDKSTVLSDNVNSEYTPPPFYSTYEFAIHESDVCAFQMTDEFSAFLTVSFSDAYLDALTRYENNPDQITATDIDGNPIYPDYQLFIYNDSGEKLVVVDKMNFPRSSVEPVLSQTPEGNVAVLSTTIDPSDGAIRVSFTEFDKSGAVKSPQESLAFRQPMVSLTKFAIDGQNIIYVIGETEDSHSVLSAFSLSGDCLGELDLDNKNTKALLPSTQGALLVYEEFDSVGNGVTSVQFVSADPLHIGSSTVLPEYSNECHMFFLRDDNLYFANSESIYRLSLMNHKDQKILSWDQVDLSFSPYEINVSDEGLLRVTGQEFGEPTFCTALLTPSDTDPNEGRTDIVVGCYSSSSDKVILKAAKTFNQNNPAYRIVFRDYADDFEYTDSYIDTVSDINTQMFLEYASGNEPDIFIDNAASLGLPALETDAYLIDLYPYIQNDPDFDPDKYFTNTLFGYETEGKLYLYPSGFFTKVFYGNPEIVGTDFSLTYEDFYRLQDRLGPEVRLLTDIPKLDLLSWKLETSMHDFVDLQSGEVSFTSDEFAELLQWANTFGSDTDDYVCAPFALRDGQIAIDLTWIDSPWSFYSNYDVCKTIPTYIGYPGNHSNGLTFSPEYVCAITTGCEKPDIAWKFVRQFLLDDVQDNLGAGYIPVSKESAKNQIVRDMELNSELIDPAIANEDFWREYFRTLEHIDTPIGTDYEIIGIVMEECAPYFSGQKTIEDVADLIQNRVQIYVDERSD